MKSARVPSSMKRLTALLCFASALVGLASAQSVKVTTWPSTYTAAEGQITVAVEFNFATPTSLPSAMAFEITAPAGWSYGGGYTGDAPATAVAIGSTGPLGFPFSSFDTTLTPGKIAF